MGQALVLDSVRTQRAVSTWLATASNEGTAKIWDVATGQERLTLRGHTDRIVSVAFDPTGQRRVTGSNDHTARIWDATTGQIRVILQDHADIVAGVVYSPDGQRIATASGDGTAKIWDAASGQEIATLPGHTGGVLAVAWSPDGRFIATAGVDGTVRQYVAHLPDLMMLAAQHVTRSLTPEERAIYLGELTPVPSPALTLV